MHSGPRMDTFVSTMDGPSRTGLESAGADGLFLFLFAGDSARRIELPVGAELTIGRDEGCEICIADLAVSRAHARVRVEDGRATLMDLGSHNGTRVNAVQVKGTRVLQAGDTITLGSATMTFYDIAKRTRHSPLVDAVAFQAELGRELKRAQQFERMLGLVVFRVDTPLENPLDVELQVLPFECGAWLEPTLFALLVPEAAEEQLREAAARVMQTLASARAGFCLAPEDGVDAASLLQSASDAAALAPEGQLQAAREVFPAVQVGALSVVVADQAMVRLYQLAKRLAAVQLPVLVCGETGGGKELVANAIHAFSARSTQRFVGVNCASLSEGLLESTLFGHEKGAFTGAAATQVGFIEVSSGGTLFLDEVGEMSMGLQAKILRVLETHTFSRVGDTKERAVDLRVVAATHRDLHEEVKAGRFRKDLFFRLAGATLWVPPLRARPGELVLLARAFLKEACAQSQRGELRLSAAAVNRLVAHPWPGNVRELKNVMAFLVATTSTQVIDGWQVSARLDENHQQSEPLSLPQQGAFRPIAEEVLELEHRRMSEALEAHGGNQTRAAAAIGMPLRTFVTRWKQFKSAR